MRNRKCSLIAVLLMLFTFFLWADFWSQDVQASPAKAAFAVRIIDDADLFTAKEEAEIMDLLQPFTTYGNALAATADKNGAGTVQDLAVQYYDLAFGTACGAVFLIDMDDREIYWYSEGDMYDILTVKQAIAITDNAYSYASKGDYTGCVEKAFTEAVTVIEGGRIRNNMKVYGNLLLAIILALFVNYLFLRKTSFIRPRVEGEKEELIMDFMELTVLGSTQISSQARDSAVKHRQSFGSTSYGRNSYSGSSYSGSSSYSSSSRSSSSGSSNSSSSSRSSGSSRSSSSSRSSGSSSGSSHRGGGAGHRF